MDGAPLSCLRGLIDEHGGEAAFKGWTTSNVKRNIIVPRTQATQLSLCAQMRLEGDPRIQPATWFVSHPWQIQFLDLVSALEEFFADKPGAILWLDLMSTSQHATFSKPPQWWQDTFCSAIGRMGQMVMVMTPWDNPVCLTRAWCLIELYACRSSGSNFCVALPPSERAHFLEQIAERGAAFYGMLSKVNTAKSECSRDSDRERIFEAVRGLEGGFIALDRSVLQTMTDWLQMQLEQEVAASAAACLEEEEWKMATALGRLFQDKGEYGRALPLLEECLTKRKRAMGENHPQTLLSIDNLANLFESMGQYDRALPLHEECLAKRKVILAEQHPETLVSLGNLANLFESMGQYDRALPLAEECLAKRKQVLGDEHPDSLASLNNLANLLQSMGQYDRALPLSEACLALRRRVLGEDHPHTLISLNNLALLFKRTGEQDSALPLYEECLAKSRRVLGDDHPDTLQSINNIGTLFISTGQYDRALPLFDECLAKSRRVLGHDHPDTLETLNNIGALFFKNGDYFRALLHFEDCLARYVRALGNDHPDTKGTRSWRDACKRRLASRLH